MKDVCIVHPQSLIRFTDTDGLGLVFREFFAGRDYGPRSRGWFVFGRSREFNAPDGVVFLCAEPWEQTEAARSGLRTSKGWRTKSAAARMAAFLNALFPPGMSAGEAAYKVDVIRHPRYDNGTPRDSWGQLDAEARRSWKRLPQPREWQTSTHRTVYVTDHQRPSAKPGPAATD